MNSTPGSGAGGAGFPSPVSRCRRAAARSAASARSSPPTRSPAPARCRVPIADQPGPLRLRPAALARPTTPAPATARSASAGACRCRRSRARPTRACRSTATRDESGRLHPLRRRGPGARARRRAGRPGAAPRDARRRRRRPTRSAATGRASRGCSRASSAGRTRPTRPTPSGARSRATTSPPGTAATPRAASPTRPIRRRIFSWLICETRDDKGNAVVYGYKAEDGARRRPDAGARAQPRPRRRSRSANRYLKRIRYGNRAPLLAATGRRPRSWHGARRDATGCFEVVFDYGEHDADDAAPAARAAAHGRAATIRSRPTAPASRSAPTGCASAC